MQANLLIIDNQNAAPSKKPGYGKGLIEEDREPEREETDFSSTLAEVAGEEQSYPVSADESRVDRKKSGNGDAESDAPKKDANGETKSEDIKEDATRGLAKAGKTSGPYLVLDGKAGAGSGNERVVEGEELPANVKGINSGEKGFNKADHKTSMDLNKVKTSTADLPRFGLEGKQGESEVEKGMAKPEGLEKREGVLHEVEGRSSTKGQETLKVAEKPEGFEKTEGHLREVGAKSATKGKETSGATVKPEGLEKVEGLLRKMEGKSSTKGQETLKVAEKPEGFEKTEGHLREVGAKSATKGKETSGALVKPRGLEKLDRPLKGFGEELDRINRDVQDKEPAAQKLRIGSVKGSTEASVQKEPGVEAATPRLGLDPKDSGSETVKAKISAGDLTHKKVEKTEPGNGENSNLSSRNFSTPDKGTGAISQSKEPQAFTKSAQADALRQIVNKAALNVGNGRSEFKIDLKPESLGHLKMQIITEHHHVTVRIFVENPLVKDMIESNLAQLKANFQNQGLEIEKFDVSVAQDSDKNGTGDGRYGSEKMRANSGDTERGYSRNDEESEGVDHLMRMGQQEGAVDFFA